MKNIEEINKDNVKKIIAKKKIPEFFAGDTVKIGVRISEGKRGGIYTGTFTREQTNKKFKYRNE